MDALVFGTFLPVNPAAYPQDVRAALLELTARAAAFRSTRPVPRGAEARMVAAAWVNYERRLVALTPDPRAPVLAAAYVDALPDGPFRDYLPLLAAHRWLCAAEGFDDEREPVRADAARRAAATALAIARRSSVLLIRTAAGELAARGTCRVTPQR